MEFPVAVYIPDAEEVLEPELVAVAEEDLEEEEAAGGIVLVLRARKWVLNVFWDMTYRWSRRRPRRSP